MSMSIGRADRILSIFKSMEMGSAVQSMTLLEDWLKKKNNELVHFIDGRWQCSQSDSVTTVNIFSRDTQSHLAASRDASEEDVDHAVRSAAKAGQSWREQGSEKRAAALDSLTTSLEQHSALLSLAVCQDNGATLRHVRNYTLPRAVHTVHYYAGWARLHSDQITGSKPDVSVVIASHQSPLESLLDFALPALASGSSVIILPHSSARLTALVFADIFASADLPEGVVNVVTGADPLYSRLLSAEVVTSVGFAGDLSSARKLGQVVSPGQRLTLDVLGCSTMIVLESADLDSAISCIIECMGTNEGRTAVSCLLVQQSVYPDFVGRLKDRLSRVRIGAVLDSNCDVSSSAASPSASVLEKLQLLREEGAEVFTVSADQRVTVPPTLVMGAASGGRRVFGACSTVLVVEQFRTCREAITLANSHGQTVSASVWCSQQSQAMEVAQRLQIGTVWLNCHGVWHASAVRGKYALSSNAPLGGQLSLCWFSGRNSPHTTPNRDLIEQYGVKNIPAPSSRLRIMENLPGVQLSSTGVHGKYRLYYGGIDKSPLSSTFCTATNSDGTMVLQVPLANSKDASAAIQAAVKAQFSWASVSSFQRSRLLLKLAASLHKSSERVVSCLRDWGKMDLKLAEKEVEVSVRCLRHWSSLCDKLGNRVASSFCQNNPLDASTSLSHLVEPVGVVAAVFDNCDAVAAPLSSLIMVLASAIAGGNSVLVVPPEQWPVPGLLLPQVFQDSGVPAGLISLLTGSSSYLCRNLCGGSAINALWLFGSPVVPEAECHAQTASMHSLRRVMCSDVTAISPGGDCLEKMCDQLVPHVVNVKSVWLSHGHIFAN